MSFEIQCGQCGQTLRAGASHVGKKARCPKCGAAVMIRLPDAGSKDVDQSPTETVAARSKTTTAKQGVRAKKRASDSGSNEWFIRADDEQFGPVDKIAGTFSGRLGNGGDAITLRLPRPYDAAILRFTYDDAWYPTTDGGGAALTVVDTTVQRSAWSDREKWTAA